MKREFHHTYTVRYDEADSYGFLTPTSFVRYMQEIAVLDAQDVQLVGNGYWVVKRSIISFQAPVPVHTRLELKTYGIGFTRITAQRGYDAYLVGDDRAEPVIAARTLWVYLDTRGRPIRLPERTAEIWLPDGPQPQQPQAPWPAFPTSPPASVIYPVRFSDIDSMKHMNNAAYVEALDNAAWEAYRQGGIQPDEALITACDYDIEYGESALFGEQLEIQSWCEPFPSAGKEFVRLQQIKREGAVLLRARSRWIWKM